MRFDFIDFGASPDCPIDVSGMIEKRWHNSTASLLASLLRRRDAPYSKVFCYLKPERDVWQISTTQNVRYIDSSFPFADYAAETAQGRLALFGSWLVQAIANGAPELAISADEAQTFAAELASKNYIYQRTARLKASPGQPAFRLAYEHGPNALTVTVSCRLGSGERVSQCFQDERIPPDELVYGGAIRAAYVDEAGRIRVEGYVGSAEVGRGANVRFPRKSGHLSRATFASSSLRE